MSNFNEYFDESFEWLRKTFDDIDIDPLLKDEMYIIAGDFHGIQQFIFNDLQRKSVAKVLRSRSAYIQLFTQFVASYVCRIFDLSSKHVIAINAGKFEVLIHKFELEKFDSIKKDIEKYFIENFCATSGISLIYQSCHRDDFQSEVRYKVLREKIGLLIEEAKLRKFDLISLDTVVLHKREDIDFINLGSRLVFDGEQRYRSDELGIEFNDFICDILLDERTKSYVFKENAQIADFKTLAEKSIGVKAIAVLKADVDGMGIFIKDSSVTCSFENFELFSKSMDSFFSIYIQRIMKENFPHTYTIFAGGDDLLLVGAWSEVLELARFMEIEFKKFVKNNALSISFGIVLAKPTTPIGFLSSMAEELLEESKKFEKNKKTKDAISVFGETARWSDYQEVFRSITYELEKLSIDDSAMAFLYRLLEFCNMSKNIGKDIKNALWRSKFSYSINRNFPDAPESLIRLLNDKIESHPEEVKMSLCEFIYKRREQ